MNRFHVFDRQKVWKSTKNTGLFFNEGKSGMLVARVSSSSDFSNKAFITGIKHEYCSVMLPVETERNRKINQLKSIPIISHHMQIT